MSPVAMSDANGSRRPSRGYEKLSRWKMIRPSESVGNSGTGIDCSGLVQAALLAAGHPCPGDSDLQEAVLGAALEPGIAPERGDLYFWKGHAAMAVDAETLIHANAHHMAVAYEPIAAAIARIAAQGGGPVTSRRRLQVLG